MLIVHVIRQFHPAVGGMESVAHELAKLQVAAGHQVRVVTLNRVFKDVRAAPLPASESVDGIDIVRIPFFGSTRYPIAPAVIKFIRDADVVHVHAIDFFFDYLAWTKCLHRKKLVVSTHGGFFHTGFAARLKRLYFSAVTRLSLAWYDAVAAVSAADHELFGKISKRGIVCIENGANVGKYRSAGSAVPTKTIIALGRLSSNKGLERLLAFLAALRRHDPQWKLMIAGRPWDVQADDLTALARSLHIDDAVKIIVGPGDDDIRELMNRCSVLASASTYEGFGVSALEGMSAGLFPLLSDIPTFRRLLARLGVGMLVDFSNAEAAAEQFVARWRTIEADYFNYRQSSIIAAAEYDWRSVAQEYMELYELVCSTKSRSIFGVPVSVGTAAQETKVIDDRFEQKQSTAVAFANTHLLNVAYRDEQLRQFLRQALVLNDGFGADIGSLILFGSAFPQNLNGTDFIPYYLQNTRHRYRIFLLGARPGIAELAARHLSMLCPRHRIVGCQHGYFRKEQTTAINARIRSLRADVVLVGMGVPYQERWLAANLQSTGARIGFGVGALFDFASGNVTRAPLWMRSIRQEWLYRLVKEPRRLGRRYILGNPLFAMRVLGQRLSHLRRQSIDLKSSQRSREDTVLGREHLL